MSYGYLNPNGIGQAPGRTPARGYGCLKGLIYGRTLGPKGRRVRIFSRARGFEISVGRGEQSKLQAALRCNSPTEISNPASLCQRVRNFGRAYPLRVFGRGLPIEAPLQLVSSNEFWSVVLTPFDQGGSESEPPSDGSTFARCTIMASVSNVHLFPGETFKKIFV